MPVRILQRVPEEELEFGEDPSRPKIEKNIVVFFLQFSRGRFRDICQKPPENARVGENKPHLKTVKCDSLLVVSNNLKDTPNKQIY